MPLGCRIEGKKYSLGFPLICFPRLCLAVLQLIVHCGYIKMIMNKCIINSTPPSVDPFKIATRRNENIIVSSALSVSHIAGVKRRKAIQQAIMAPFIWGEFKTRSLLLCNQELIS